MEIKNWLKTNWKLVITCAICLLWLTKCSESNRRNNIIQDLKSEIAMNSDSLKTYKDSVFVLNTELHDFRMMLKSSEQQLEIERKHSDNFSDIVIGNQSYLMKKSEKLNDENKKMKKELMMKNKIIDSLNAKISFLETK